MSSGWDEIKRLAADFQKVQLTTTLQRWILKDRNFQPTFLIIPIYRLSERNCIEVVSLLIEKGLLEIIFTNDGKEYLTPEQLTSEINDELFINGGRVNLADLAKILNVDLNKVWFELMLDKTGP